ncbi:dynamin family protein [Limnoraphis robusta]|uniref:Dynamin family protein n=1 Tax=Limnoraphis robusta CCNP1315 TaxID=3110306 RepID=A0ABU5TRT3_9CYAN|nr:dynamin family protein [Limnoraphis robusta]MEA5517627.1 dynamin family protein [Limnoraphis robusta CCNP1315]MEA5545741.1 dynamin family protein [Limnoraphis robusta CCNP1324]
MDMSLINADTVDLLSRITGHELEEEDLSPLVVFLAALVCVLLGVISVDNQVTQEETQRLLITLRRFIPETGNVRELVKLMKQGVRLQKTYQNINDLLLLTASFSESEKLLLIGLGYEMSAADGSMDAREKKYLENLANRLRLEPQYLNVLESAFSNPASVNKEYLEKVRFLLDPVWFHDLDSVFVKAASQMLAVLPVVSEKKKSQQHRTISYEALQAFQECKRQLDQKCVDIYQIVQDCTEREFLQASLIEEIGKVSKKLQSQRFRVAVVGEFSQGKSTILNALLGEKIQPVRAIPCSGTVTVLRYGEQKRVICCYKDKRQEEIPLELYQEKAAISKEAAQGNITEGLANSEVIKISEIIFEHPNLELCRYGVEIVDSPGLNEHPERTDITKQLLQDTDVVIFVTDASRLLTQGERELLDSLKNQLNGGNEEEPANNLFILANRWDLLRTENDRQEVQERIENLVMVQNPIISGENRIHFISAQETLDAILAGTENEYLQSFSHFTQSLEQFLTEERGIIEVNTATTKVNQLIQSGLKGLHQSEKILEGKLQITEKKKTEIIEKMGEISGRDVKIKIFADQELEDVIDEVLESWNKWLDKLDERIIQSSEQWTSTYSPFKDKKKLIKDYGDQFMASLLKEIKEWESTLKDDLLLDWLKTINGFIQSELEEIKNDLTRLDSKLDTYIGNQFTSTLIGNVNACRELGINPTLKSQKNEEEDFHVFAGLGTAGGLAIGAALAFTGIGLIPLLIGGVGGAVTGVVGSALFGKNKESISAKVKEEVCQAGLKNFYESQQQLFDNICEQIEAMYDTRVELASNLIKQAISLCENPLKQQEKDYQKSVQQRQQDQVWIQQQRQRLEQVRQEIEAIVRDINP